MRCVHLAVALSLFAVTSCGGSSSSPGAPSAARPAASASPSVTGIAVSATGGPSIFGASAVDLARCLQSSGDAECFSGARPVVRASAAGAVAPGAPGSLRGLTDRATVNLVWNAPTSGDPVAGYIIEAGSATGLSDLAVLSIGDTRTSFSASNVGNGTYYVRVKARNAAGTSAASNEIVLVVNVVTCLAPPQPPSGLVSTVDGNSVTLTWTAASGSPSTYVVAAGSAPLLSDLAIVDLGSTATTMTANDLGAGKYYIRVRAKNACGTSGSSNEVIVNVLGPQGILAGTWTGTDKGSRGTQTANFAVTFVFQHSGQTLVSDFANGFKLSLTQTAATGAALTFSGTLSWGSVGQCKEPGTGGMTVDTATNTMTGSFTGLNQECVTETNNFTLKKQ